MSKPTEPLTKTVKSWLDQAEAAVVAAEAGSWEQIVAAVDARATRAAFVLRDVSAGKLARLDVDSRMGLLAVLTDPRLSYQTESFILPAAQKLLDSMPLPAETLAKKLAVVDAFANEIKTKPDLAGDRAVWALHDDAGRADVLNRAAGRFAALIGLAPVPSVKVERKGWDGRYGGPVESAYNKGAITLTVNIDPHVGAGSYDAAVMALAAALVRQQQADVRNDRIKAIMTHKAPELPADFGDRLLHLSARCPMGHGSLNEMDRRPHMVLAKAMAERLRLHLAPGLFERAPKTVKTTSAKAPTPTTAAAPATTAGKPTVVTTSPARAR